MPVTSQVISSLEIAAENYGDISPMIYERFFQKCPQSKELMSEADDHSKGLMFQEVVRLLMVEDLLTESGYLDFETRTHSAYQVKKQMYEQFLTSTWEVVKECVDERWTNEFNLAWQNKVEMLLVVIDKIDTLKTR